MLTALTLLACAAAPAPPRNVYVGAFLSDVSDFDLKAGRFQADLIVWVKWLGDDQVPLVTFENAELSSREEVGREHDAAWHSVRWRVQGTFRGDFPLHAFPFDRQTLPVVFGLDERDGVLVPDLGASGMSEHFSITGWAYEPSFSARTEERTYRSDLGSVSREGERTQRRLALFAVEMKRPFGPYLVKFALPLLLILLMALLALVLPPERLDVRSALGITALLAAIAFHYTQAGTLPDVTYLVAADMLFLASYVFIAGTLVLSVVSFRLNERRPAAAHRADRAGLWLLPTLTALTLSVLVSNARPPVREVVAAPLPPPRASQPLLRVGVPSLDGPGQRADLVVRRADGTMQAVLVEEAPALTNSLVRLLPDGGMRIRWRLRPDTRWSDGSALTADDLAFSLARVIDPLRIAVTRVDERTLEVTYSARHSEWLSGFTVFPQRAAMEVEDAGPEALTRASSEGRLSSGGPLMFARLEPGRKLTLVRNPQYAGPAAVFEQVELHALAPMNAAHALLEGKLDVVPSLTPEAWALLRDQPSVRLLEQPGDVLWVLVPNLASPPLNELALRRALLAAIDRPALVQALAPSPARVAWGWLAGRELPLPKTPLPLQGLHLKLNVAPREEGAIHSALADRLVVDLARVGVTLELNERADLNQAVPRGDFEGLALVSSETGDPGRFMNVTDSSGRPRLDRAVEPHFDDEMVERYEAWVASLYTERRAFLGEAMQEAWFKRLPMLPLVLGSRLAAVRSDLVGPEWGAADSLWWNLADWHLTAPTR